jgi:hypothetical protein
MKASRSSKNEKEKRRNEVNIFSKQNLSFVLEGIHQVKFEDRPIPELKDPHHVLVNVKFTGICGSDVCACAFSLTPYIRLSRGIVDLADCFASVEFRSTIGSMVQSASLS